MKKRIFFLLALMMLVFLSGCGHEHQWTDATCTEPKTCSTCGETEGEPLGHTWTDATCTEPKTCSVCGETEGEPLGHTWTDATCTEPKICSVCGETEGEPLGHTWTDATCTEPKTCSVCGEIEGKPLGHTTEEWVTTVEATCTSEGEEAAVCTVCGETVTRKTEKLAHTPGDWTVVTQPTIDSDGVKAIVCTECGKELERETFSLSPEEVKKLYIQECKSIKYDKLSRSPGEYEGQKVKFTGRVVQVCSEASSAFYYSTYRVATSGRYKDVIYVKIDNYGSGSRILENDKITLYGTFDGLYTYTTVMGASVTIPSITAEYVN